MTREEFCNIVMLFGLDNAIDTMEIEDCVFPVDLVDDIYRYVTVRDSLMTAAEEFNTLEKH